MKKFYESIKLLIATMAVVCSADVMANPIEFQGDRYIINVEELDLNGDESLADVLLMCPEALTMDGKETASATTFDNFQVRTDNLNIDIDEETFLTQTRAREVKQIKICTHPGVMKGCGNFKKVIDVYFKRGDNGYNGALSASVNSQGNISTYDKARYQTNNLTAWGMIGGRTHYNSADGYKTYGYGEDAKVGINWDITKDDNLIVQLSQVHNGAFVRGNDARNFTNYYNLSLVYTRMLSDNGASFLFQGVGDLNANHSCSKERKNILSRYKETDPYVVFEFYFPLPVKDLWMTAGIEAGLTNFNNESLLYYNYNDGAYRNDGQL